MMLDDDMLFVFYEFFVIGFVTGYITGFSCASARGDDDDD